MRNYDTQNRKISLREILIRIILLVLTSVVIYMLHIYGRAGIERILLSKFRELLHLVKFAMETREGNVKVAFDAAA